MKSKNFLKIISSVLVFTFTTTQITWGQEYLAPAPQNPQAYKEVSENAEPVSSSLDQASIEQTSQQFLEDSLTLSPAAENEEKTAEAKLEKKEASSQDFKSYDFERYDFQDAKELLREEFAAAVILKDLKKEDLEELVNLDFETGVLVLNGEIVLFTSGSQDEIGVLPAVKALTEKASFISHTHPMEHSKEGPSGQDINEAVKAPKEEYVVTHKGAYAYNSLGVLNNGESFPYEGYIEKLYEALELSIEERDQVAARAELNLFIAEQERYNQAEEEERVTLRRGGSLASTAGLTSSSVTSLPGSPYPYLTPGSTAATTLSSSSSTQFLLGYSVPNAGNSSGFTISFDNATTPAVETQNISALGSLTFGLLGPNTSAKLEIIDLNGNKDTWTLTGIATAEKFWRLPVASIANTLDKTKIKQFNFIVEQANTTSTTRTGTFTVRSTGLNVANPAKPAVTSTVPANTNQTVLALSGTKEANTAILINGVQVVAANSSTTWSANYNLTVEGNNSISITAKSAIGKVSTAAAYTVKRDTVIPVINTFKINNDSSLYALSSPVTLTFTVTENGSGMDKMSFSTDNVNWSTPVTYSASSSYPLPTGDGSKTVYARIYDKTGNVSAVASKTIILDTLPPTGTLKVNGGVQAVNQTAVTLNLLGIDTGSGMYQMSFSTNNSTWSTAEAYSATKSWIFPSGDGNKTVYVKFWDKANRLSAAPNASVTVLLDTAAPTGSININSGGTLTNSRDITLNLLADAGTGSIINTMSFSTDNTNWTAPETYSQSKNFTLPAGDGNKTVYVKYYDLAGNVSAVYSKAIVLDMTPPVGTIQVTSEPVFANPGFKVNLALTGTDGAQSAQGMRFSWDSGQTWTSWENFTASKQLTLTTQGGQKQILYQFRDAAGNVSEKQAGVLLPHLFEAENMEVAQNYWVNQSAGVVLLWSNAELSENRLIEESGIYEIEVIARGVEGEGGAPLLQMRMDNVDVGTVPVPGSSSYQSYKFSGIEVDAGTRKVSLAYVNDTGVRDLWIDRIILRKVSDFPPQERIVIPAVEMQRQGDTWSGGSYISLWGNGRVFQEEEITEGGLYDIEVYASSNATGAQPVYMQLTADNRQFSEPVPIFSNYWSYKKFVYQDVELDAGNPKFSIMTADWLNGQTLGIQKIVLKRKGDFPADEKRIRLEAENMQKTIGQASVGGWNLLSNGSVYDTLNVPEAGIYALDVYAFGQSALGVAPLMDVILDGNTVAGNISVANHHWSYDDYRVSGISLGAGNHTVSVSYKNDYYGGSWETDRNLYVDKVVFRQLAKYEDVINDGALYAVNRNVNFDLDAVESGLEWDSMRFSLDGGTSWSDWDDYESPTALMLNEDNGMKTIWFQLRTAEGEINTFADTILLDTAAPAGSVKINNDANYTGSRDVTLTLTASDYASGLDKMRFSTDSGTTWSSWEDIASSKNLTLPVGEGSKEVRYQLRDKALNLETYTDVITLDQTGPVVDFKINGGTSYAGTTQVVLNISASDALSGLGQMRFTTDTVNWVWSEWEDFQTTKNFTLPSTNGLTQVFMQIYDKVWNHSTVSDEIYLDTVNPAGSLSINSDANYTASAGVTLNLSAQDSGSGIEKMSFSTDNVQWSAPETYSTSKSFNLSNGDGNKTVYVKYFDAAGNASPVYSKSIVLDTVAPTSSFVINNDEPTTGSRDVTFTLGGSDMTSGLDKMRFSFDGAVTWSDWETFASSKQVTLPEGLGIKQVHFQVKDKSGNISAAITDSIEVVQGTGIVFTSSAVSSQQDYALTYTLNGVSVTENWKLASGQNDLLVRGNANGALIYAKHTVVWNQSLPSFPTMPAIPAPSEDLVSVTSESGHVLKYSEGELESIEKPGEYELFLPELDGEGNLIGGVLRYLSGDLVLLQNSKPYYGVSAAGEKTLYGAGGRVEHFQAADGKRSRFAYRVNAAGNTLSLLSFEENIASLYENSLPAWIIMQDGTEIRYDSGFLKEYLDAAGNRFTYSTQSIQFQGAVTGYSSQLVSVTPSGSSSPVLINTILSNLSSYSSIKTTLENKLALTLEYNTDKKMKKFVSGKNEILTLSEGLPAALTTASGQVIGIQSAENASGELVSLAFMQNNLGQTYDESGRLKGITLSDGTLLTVQNQVLSEISLSDGSKLSSLKWNGEILVDFIRTRADGGREIYTAQKLVKKIDPNGNVTTYIRINGVDRPDMMTMPDGRTYHFIEYQNAQGLTERISELVSMDLEDGGRIEFKNGKPFRYIQKKQVQRSPLEIPDLPQGQSYVPLVTLENAELRSLTIDVNATILSGEILFHDGTQFFIRNGELYKQITPDGKIIETSEEDLPPVETFPGTHPDPLNAQELAYRNQLVDAQLDFFMNGIGIDPLTGFPMDNYDGISGTQSTYSQTTLVGMWAEILAAIARGDHQTSKMTSLEAYQKLEQILDNLVDVQTQAGWFGMFSFFGIEHTEEAVLGPNGLPTGETVTVTTYKRQFKDIGIGDNLNLSVSLASVIGAISGINDPSTNAMRDRITAYAQLILSKQNIGYDKFYDPSAKRLRMARVFNENGTEQFSGYMDRVFNEFRTGMIWLAAQDPKYKDAVSNLDVAIRPYETADGRIIDNAVPYDGGSFQMFWPLIHVDETKYPEFDAALKNFLYTQADYVKENEVPGLLSAGSVPGMSYQGKIGVPGAAETDDALFTDTGSIYGTASAFLLVPHYTLQFLKNLETAFPGIRSPIGYTDALKLRDVTHTDPVTGEQTVTREPAFADQYYGVDQASFMLSLLGTSRNYFSNYLENKGIEQTFDQIYSSMVFGLSPVAEANPAAPDFNPAGTPQLSSELNSDGLSHSLVKRGAFISSVNDPELGEGKIYDYLTPNGKYHHTEIVFENRSYSLQEYILLPGRGDSARSLAEGLRYDLLNEGTAQGVFYTPNQGYANNALTADSQLGEVHQLSFEFQDISKPVGLWAQYSGLDLTRYDYLSIPIKLGANTPEGVRLKFELKGMGQVYLSPEATQEWQFVQIPISKPAGLLNEIAVSVQTPAAEPLTGEILLGAFSAFKVRSSNQMDWLLTLGKTDTELRNLLKQMAVQEPSLGGGLIEADEILENFTLDHAGKLVSGTLRLADGGIQYYQKGLLNKWVFVNGRTVLFEKGLATFAIDLARGQLEEGRFYYDKSFSGQIRSFVLQDNDRKRIYGGDGKLQTMIDSGHTVQFINGVMSSITTPEGVLTEMEFADDGSLLRAHVRLTDGAEFDIDQTAEEQMVMRPNGVKIYYRSNRISAIETPQNGRTDFTYSYNSVAQLLGVEASFNETITDPMTGQPVIVTRNLSLFDYLKRPERTLEKSEMVGDVRTVLPGASVADFTVPGLASNEWNYARASYNTWFSFDVMLRDYAQSGDAMGYLFKYQNATGSILGSSINHSSNPVNLTNYDFVNITLRQAPDMDWNQDFNLRLKSPQSSTLYSFELQNAGNNPQTFSFPLDGKVGTESQLTLELVRENGGLGKLGRVYVQDISYVSLKSIDKPFWEEVLAINGDDLRSIKNESDALISVGAEVASGKPRTFTNLVSYLDLPSWVIYTDRSAEQTGQLVSFKRFDGSEVFVDANQSVTKMILPDGTVNEYSSAGTGAQNTIQGPGSTDQETADYQYGEIRTVTQSNGRKYNFAYEFDEAGSEITIMKDSVSGEERRFKNGQLLQASNEGLETKYSYAQGELTAANMIYKNRVLESTSYFYTPEETLVKDERGTTWYYDTNGNLVKHLTKDGYLYQYSNYTFEPEEGMNLPENDYKRAVFAAEDLRSVYFTGYEAADGSQLLVNPLSDEGGSEIKFMNGDHGVNLELDGDRKIKYGQIQFKDGLIVEIENYIPVRGRLADGEFFNLAVPTGETYELLQGEAGAYLGTQVKANGKLYTYDLNGRLTKSENEFGESDTFTYTLNAAGVPTAYQRSHNVQLAFNGVPYPKTVDLTGGSTQKVFDSGTEVISHEGNGFVISVFKEDINQWDSISGTFTSGADRFTLEHFLQEVKPGQAVAMMVSDTSFSSAGNSILTLLEGLGAGQVRAAASSNHTWAFFGNESLASGQAAEKTGSNSFSTLTKTVTNTNIPTGTTPLLGAQPIVMGMNATISTAYDRFLKNYEILKPSADTYSVTVYDKNENIVFTRRIDGVYSYYQNGKVRETFNPEGQLLSIHDYICSGECETGDDMTLSRIRLVKARADFEKEAAELEEKIEQAKFDALYRLAWQDEAARLRIQEEVDSAMIAISQQISSLESQRFQNVKQCGKGFLGFGKKCKNYTVEVPGVAEAISNLHSERSNILRAQQEQLLNIPGEIAERKLEIENATAQRLSEVAAKRQEIMDDMLRQEIEPILMDYYRRILGRDPSTAEINSWLDRSRTAEALNIPVLNSELIALPERTTRENQKSAIITGVKSFLHQYLAAAPEQKTQMLASLQLLPSEAMNIEQIDLDGVFSYLDSRSLHFGQSAFGALQEMLKSKGTQVSLEILGTETLLIDILTGVINRFAEGELVLSMFALSRTAKIHGQDFSSVKYSLQNLKDFYQAVCPPSVANCNLRMIAHVSEDHFVTITRVTATEVVLFETSKGAQGEEKSVSHSEFLKVWDVENGQGYLLVDQPQVIASKVISDQQAQKIRGAFWPLFFFIASIILSLASIAVSYISPTLGKILGYAAMIAGIAGIVASVGSVVVNGLKAAYTAIQSQGFFATIRAGLTAVGKFILSPVKYIGRFINSGFSFSKDGFIAGLDKLGSGITQIKNFLFDAKGPIVNNVQVFSKSQIAARTLIAPVLNYSVSKGLEGLGLNSTVARLAGAFVSAGFSGVGGASSNFLKSGLQGLLMQGVSEIGLKLNLPPPATSALSLLAGNSLKAWFDPTLTLKQSLTQIAPQVAKQFILGGVQLIGRSLGWNPKLSYLVGLPLAGIIGGITSGLLNHSSIFNSIKETLFSREMAGGIISATANLAVDKWGTAPVLIALAGGKLLTSAISGFLTKGNQGSFGSVVYGIIGGGSGFIKNLVSSAIADAPELIASVQEGESLGDVFERFATGMLARSTLEDVVGIYGSIKAAYDQGKQQSRIVTLRPGVEAREIQMGTDKEPMTVWESLDGKKTLRIETKDRIVEGDDIKIVGQNFVLTSGTVTYKNTGTDTLVHEVYENNQLLQRQVIGDNQFVDMYGDGRTSSGAAKPLKFDQAGNIVEGIVENLASGERVIYSTQTIRIEKSDKRLFSQESNGLNYWFSYGGGNIQFEEYDRTTGQLIAKGDTAKQTAASNTVFVTKTGQMPGVNSQSVQTSPGTTKHPDPISQQNREKAEELLKEKFGAQFNLSGASGAQMPTDYRQETINQILNTTNAAEFEEKLNQFLLGNYGQAEGDLLLEQMREANNEGKSEYGSSFSLGKKWSVLEGEFDFNVSNNGTKTGKYELSFVNPGSRQNLIGDFFGVNADISVGAGGKISEAGFTRIQPSFGISTSVEQDVTQNPFSGFVGIGSGIFDSFFRDTEENSIAQKTGVQFVESNFFAEAEGVLSKGSALFQGSFAQGVSTTFNIPNPDPGIGGKLMSLNTKVVRENGVIKAKITLGDIAVAGNPDIRAQLTLEASITSSDANNRETRESFTESFNAQLNALVSQVGGGTWIPGAGGILGGAMHQVSDVVASQLFEVNQMQQQSISIDDLLAGKTDLVGKLDTAFLNDLLRKSSNGIKIISF